MDAPSPHPPAPALYDAIAAGYDANPGPHQAIWQRITLAAIAPHLPRRPGRILDAGAGTGALALPLLRAGHDVTLLDPSPAMLEAARRRTAGAGPGHAEFVVGRMERMELPDAAFDFVLSDGDPLSYCGADAPAAAREVLRVLRPGAWFYASCDNRWSAVAAFLMRGDVARALACAQDGASLDPYGHPLRAFDAAELQRLWAEAGAVDVRVTGKGHLSPYLTPSRLEAALAGPLGAGLEALEHALAADASRSMLAGHLQAVGRRPEAA